MEKLQFVTVRRFNMFYAFVLEIIHLVIEENMGLLQWHMENYPYYVENLREGSMTPILYCQKLPPRFRLIAGVDNVSAKMMLF